VFKPGVCIVVIYVYEQVMTTESFKVVRAENTQISLRKLR
jgi:hypothetical protein